MAEVLAQILPESEDVPSGFETVGHVAHLNLSKTQMEFKKEIG